MRAIPFSSPVAPRGAGENSKLLLLALARHHILPSALSDHRTEPFDPEDRPLRETGATVDTEAIGRFAARADAWWNPDGSFRRLRHLNPTRLRFTREPSVARLGCRLDALRPSGGL